MTNEELIKNKIVEGIVQHCGNTYVPNQAVIAKLIKDKMSNHAKYDASKLTDEDYIHLAENYVKSYYAASDKVKAQFKSDLEMASSAVRVIIKTVKSGR